MLYNVFKVLISVRAKLFFGFYAMSMVIAFLGAYAFVSISNTGDVVKATYDRPLMAINFARSANQIFSEIEMKVLQTRLVPKSNREASYAEIYHLIDEFKSDVQVARQRSIAPNADKYFDGIENLTDRWTGLIFKFEDEAIAVQESDELAQAIQEKLDIVVELQTNESFRAREASLDKISKVKRYSVMAGVFAFFLTILISSWVAVTIINPLKAAAAAARKISSGQLDVVIPSGGDDETGALLKTMSHMQDNIRERMSAEQNLRSVAQTRLAESLENSKDAILLADQDGRIIVTNNMVSELFPALKAIDLSGRIYTDFFEKYGLPKNDRCRYFHKDREIKFEDGRWARVNASDTKENGRLIIWTDITQAKERNERLLVAKEQAEAADKAKSLFLAAMSHELRTPLNAVIGFSDIIQSESLGKLGNPRYVEMAKLISQSGEHLLNIVKDVLSIANGEDGHDASEGKQAVNVTELLVKCLESTKADIEAQGMKLIYDPLPPSAFILGDPKGLKQIFANILSNSIKFNKENGIIKINVSFGRKNAVRIDIIDNGIGIPEADIDRIQDPFVQVDNGFTRQYDGAGLGLSVAKQLMTIHSGHLSIRSKVNKGTCVSLIFPTLTAAQTVSDKIAA